MNHRPTPMPSPYLKERELEARTVSLLVQGALVTAAAVLLIAIVERWPS